MMLNSYKYFPVSFSVRFSLFLSDSFAILISSSQLAFSSLQTLVEYPGSPAAVTLEANNKISLHKCNSKIKILYIYFEERLFLSNILILR